MCGRVAMQRGRLKAYPVGWESENKVGVVYLVVDTNGAGWSHTDWCERRAGSNVRLLECLSVGRALSVFEGNEAGVKYGQGRQRKARRDICRPT